MSFRLQALSSKTPVQPVVAVEGVSKRFGATVALDGVSLSLRAGEVHGLIGENGAGKSTLMKILGGVERPDAGRVLIDGRPAELGSVSAAQARGVAMIHQELNLVGELSAAENIFLGRERVRGGRLGGGWIDRARTRREAGEILSWVGVGVDPGARVAGLSIAQQQMVEIAKAVSQDARVLIMDEPTAVLTRREVGLLMALIDRLRARGAAIVYISHILGEVLTACDRVTVLRDGRVVTTLENPGRQAAAGAGAAAADSGGDAARASGEAETSGGAAASGGEGLTESRLANLMVGREMSDQFPPRGEVGDGVVLRVRGVSVPGRVVDASFEVRRGEVFGFAGLIGAGRTELAEAVAGLRARSGGVVELGGEALRGGSPGAAVARGLAYVSEDRRGRGLVMGMSIAANLTLASVGRYCRPLLSHRAERVAAARRLGELGTRLGRVTDAIDTLSGGNQQKVALGKWLETGPRLLILDEPTRGIDVGAKAEVYRLIAQLAAGGMGCVVISSEMNELLGLCHRIAVMRAGRIVGVLDSPGATEQRIMALAAGVRGETEAA